jgi:hypothetical protein
MIRDLTGTDGMGWQVVTEPHRCSRKFCTVPAVAYYASNCGGSYTKQRRHVRHKYSCEEHLREWSTMWVEQGRVLADWGDE